jgi:hypothetical protein
MHILGSTNSMQVSSPLGSGMLRKVRKQQRQFKQLVQHEEIQTERSHVLR